MPADHPSVGVIIPTCDRPETLGRAVACALSQTLAPAEVIVVDNGRAEALLEDQPHDSVQVLRLPPRVGPGAARNAGAAVSGADLVAFLDDDDLWDPQFLAHSVAALWREQARVVAGQLQMILPGDVVIPHRTLPADSAGQRAIYYKNPGFSGQNIILSRELFLSVGGFDPRMPCSEDRDLCARLLEAGERIAVEPRAVAYICEHDGHRASATNRQIKGNLMFLRKHWRHMSLRERRVAVRLLWKKIYRRRALPLLERLIPVRAPVETG